MIKRFDCYIVGAIAMSSINLWNQLKVLKLEYIVLT